MYDLPWPSLDPKEWKQVTELCQDSMMLQLCQSYTLGSDEDSREMRLILERNHYFYFNHNPTPKQSILQSNCKEKQMHTALTCHNKMYHPFQISVWSTISRWPLTEWNTDEMVYSPWVIRRIIAANWQCKGTTGKSLFFKK